MNTSKRGAMAHYTIFPEGEKVVLINWRKDKKISRKKMDIFRNLQKGFQTCSS